MPVPNTLEEWNYDVVKELAEIGQVETDRHDFKFNFSDADSHTKLCCSFANSKGGFIVVGVKERSGRFILEGIDPDPEIASKFGQKLKSIPSIVFRNPLLIRIPESTRALYVFHVPLSSERPHIPSDSDKRVFWKRINTGCEQMTLEEIRTQFMNYEERREKIKLLLLELIDNKDQLSSFLNVPEGQYSLITLDASVLDRLLVDIYSVVQRNADLVNTLLTLRRQIRVCNAKTTIFFSQMAMPLTNHNTLVRDQNVFM
jgi:hypothetical protein